MTYPATIVAVADELLCQIEAGLRYPLRSKNTFRIRTPIYLKDKPLLNSKSLDKILKASHFYQPCWHSRIISPHGDKNVIVEPMEVRLSVRKRRGDSRYVEREGVLVLVKPFRGLEVSAIPKRKRF